MAELRVLGRVMKAEIREYDGKPVGYITVFDKDSYLSQIKRLKFNLTEDLLEEYKASKFDLEEVFEPGTEYEFIGNIDWGYNNGKQVTYTNIHRWN